MVWQAAAAPLLVGAINWNEANGIVQAMISALSGYELLHIVNQ
jgi:hypothetical protein